MYKAKQNAILSFQFYKDKTTDHPMFLLTSNPPVDGDNVFGDIDADYFADELVKGDVLCLEELLFLCKFFDRVREHVKRRLNQ